MNINYEIANLNYYKHFTLDKSKKNILILGPANNDNERCNIINPVTLDNAFELYGESELYYSYKDALNITNDTNIYLSNCYTTDDYITLFDNLIQYNFDYIIPINIYLSDTFYNFYTKKYEYYANYFLEILYEANSLSTLIMTERHASLYEDIDSYLNSMRTNYLKYINDASTLKIISLYGSNLVVTYNMLYNISYSNIILGSVLSINNSYEYPKSISLIPIYDLDKNDIKDSNYVYFKFNDIINLTTLENLLNFRTLDDIYKNILINELIKSVLKILDLDEYKGKLFNYYIKLQISNKINSLLKPYINVLFKNYIINKIGFIKTSPGCGTIYVELSIIPFGLIDNINIVMEV